MPNVYLGPRIMRGLSEPTPSHRSPSKDFFNEGLGSHMISKSSPDSIVSVNFSENHCEFTFEFARIILFSIYNLSILLSYLKFRKFLLLKNLSQ